MSEAKNLRKNPRQDRKSCVICGKPVDEVLRPFCSKRCADVDLHRWLSGVYAVPGTEDDEEDDRRNEDDTPPH